MESQEPIKLAPEFSGIVNGRVVETGEAVIAAVFNDTSSERRYQVKIDGQLQHIADGDIEVDDITHVIHWPKGISAEPMLDTLNRRRLEEETDV